MASLRASTMAATALFFAAGCHLIGGINGYVEGSKEDDEGGTNGGAPGTGGAVTTSSVGGAGAGTSSAGGMAMMCTDESCMAASECQTCTCVQGLLCDCDDKDTGETCSAGYCFNGECVDCIDNMNFACASPQETCDAYLCVSAECDDSVMNGLETDIDCGGPDCAPCLNGLMCGGPADCASGYCAGTVCQNCTLQSHCSSAQYCDGASCRPKKDLFSGCDADYECQSNNCVCTTFGCACGF